MFLFKKNEQPPFQVDPILSFKILDILQQHSHLNTPNDSLSKPKTYPNNTLIVDLNKCHQNIAWFGPKTKTSQAVLKTSPLNNDSKSFWPTFISSKNNNNNSTDGNSNNDNNNASQQKIKKSNYKFQMPDSLLNANPRVS